MDLMRIYDRLPVCLQNLACTMEGIRVKRKKYGALTKKYLPNFMERDNWTYAQKCEYRDKQIQHMVEHCYYHVPYYHNLFDKLGIDYKNIKTLDDLKLLPILTKDIVRNHGKELTADNVSERDCYHMHTSGTTGSSLKFLYSKEAYAMQWAEAQRYERDLGLTGKEWNAYFGGRSIVPKDRKKPPFYRVNYAMKEVMFSAWHLCEANYPDYIKGLEKYKPEFWHGYPSSFLPLAQYLIDNNIRLSFSPKYIQLSSENVTEAQLDKMGRAFGTRPIQGYAMTEQVATFREYPDGHMYVIEDLYAVEFLETETPEVYRVVGTNLTNYAMPLLRYDTRDLVRYKETEKGREILHIDGREEDNIKLRSGVIRRLDFVFKDQVNITEAQIVQKSLDLVEFKIVKGKNYTQADEQVLTRDISEYLAGRIDYKIAYVEEIPKTKNGKMKFIVSEV